MSNTSNIRKKTKVKRDYSAAEKRRIKALEKELSKLIDTLNINFEILAAFNSDEDTYNETHDSIAYLRYSCENQL